MRNLFQNVLPKSLAKNIKPKAVDVNLCNQLIEFYYQQQQLFQNYFANNHSKKDEKNFIKTIYKKINYTNPIMLKKPDDKTNIVLYRGISAESKEDLQHFVDDFFDGEVFFGKRASLFGTGIYMSKDYKLAEKYATYSSNYGAIIKCELDRETNMIDYEKLVQIKEDVLLALRINYTNPDILKYADLLEDDGLFAAISGYDAINIPEKDFVLILNRSKLLLDILLTI